MYFWCCTTGPISILLQCRYLFPALNAWAVLRRYTRPHAWLPPWFLRMDAWMTSQLKVALIRKVYVGNWCAWLFSDMLSMGVCTTRHCQTSGQLVQKLNVCTVPLQISPTVPGRGIWDFEFGIVVFRLFFWL